MKYPKLEGVGTHLNINPKDNDFIKVRELVNNDPELLGNNDIMKFVKLALFRASEDEPVQEIAKELDDELSGYLVKTDFKLVFLPIKKGVPVMSLLLLVEVAQILLGFYIYYWYCCWLLPRCHHRRCWRGDAFSRYFH